MSPELILKEIGSLPAELQKSVIEYIRILSRTYKSSGKKRLTGTEDFFGIWKDNAIMEDSSSWVKGLRVSESNRKYE
jgi:hypothetical protein